MSSNKLALEEFPNFCVCCGFGLVKQTGEVDTNPFEVHHMDNAEQKNNKLSNLVILCTRCHRLHHLGFITKSEIKDKKKVMIKKHKKSLTSFQKYRKELANNDQKRWFQKKDWEGDWNGYTQKATKKRLANIKKNKKDERQTKRHKDPIRVAGSKKAWVLMRTKKWQNEHKDSKITQMIMKRRNLS